MVFCLEGTNKQHIFRENVFLSPCMLAVFGDKICVPITEYFSDIRLPSTDFKMVSFKDPAFIYKQGTGIPSGTRL